LKKSQCEKLHLSLLSEANVKVRAFRHERNLREFWRMNVEKDKDDDGIERLFAAARKSQPYNATWNTDSKPA